MSNSYCYYIVKNAYSPTIQVSSSGFKIYKRRSNLPLMVASSHQFDGPYATVKALTMYSDFAKELKLKFPKEYVKIINEESIAEVLEEIYMPKGEKYSIDFIEMVSHGIKPSTLNKNVSGGHLLTSPTVRIKEELEVDKNGIIRAIIEAKNTNTGKWIEKKGVTTLFPKSWTFQKYFDECKIVVSNLNKISEHRYKSKTSCGIETIVIIKDKKFKSMYPIFSI
jgi:hypothetical protein